MHFDQNWFEIDCVDIVYPISIENPEGDIRACNIRTEWLQMNHGIQLGENAPRAADAARNAREDREEERVVLADALKLQEEHNNSSD